VRLDQCSICTMGLNPEFAIVDERGVFCKTCSTLTAGGIVIVKRRLNKIDWNCPCMFCENNRQRELDKREKKETPLKQQNLFFELTQPKKRGGSL